MRPWRIWLGSIIVLGALSGCATTQGPKSVADQASGDPLQAVNRPIFHFNMGLYDYVLEPVDRGYKAVTPAFFRQGVSNVFANADTPYIFVNDFLQGRVQMGMEDLSRFLVNTIFGLGGLFDVANHLDLPKHENSLGVTLGVWGVPQGPYLVLPFYGPSSLRSLPGLALAIFTGPTYYISSSNAQYALTGMGIINTGYVDGPKIRMVQEAVNPYIFMRNAWEQHEQYLIDGGKVSSSQLLQGLELPPASGPSAATESAGSLP
ncbi:VacJ family lipoprotein [Acidithiobacillus sp.]|uniref:MlaA family lipoprotein n=1 Tax=Acidithiobacillus sp. TaxID=1872118 RepID=UPI0025B8367A|nr:VacJ family lipoprotein [Acidithiobacillus sp.]